LEGIDIVRRALTAAEPFAWHGEHYDYDTIAVWPRPVQGDSLPIFVATRSEPTVKYAAANRLGVAISYDRAEDMRRVIGAYRDSCESAGWQPASDQIAYRGGICLAETDALAEERRARILKTAAGALIDESGPPNWPVVPETWAVRNDGRIGLANPPQTNANRGIGFMLNFVGSPDTVVEQLREYHHHCGVGVVDLAFQQPGVSHGEVMDSIGLFGREVLPRIREF
jgi:alkanesulfonate monooxygenase SsuD/methylene tetrahydromethanopterin reductase-like flavin-dependent oxidoreductase (luciferase family)